MTRLLIINGSPRAVSRSRAIAHALLELARDRAEAEILDLGQPVLPPYHGDDVAYDGSVDAAVEAVERADALILISPIYHGLLSAALKNLFEFVDYKALEGKVAGIVLNSGGKISYLQVEGQIVAMMRYFRVLSVPRAVYVNRNAFGEGPRLTDERVHKRLEGLVDDTLRLAGQMKAA